MAKQDFAVIHDLSSLLVPGDEAQSKKNLREYLDKVSVFIGLPPELNGLDTIWMRNENGPGQSLVVYARRGTAEILRNKLGIEVSSLTNQMVKDSIVFTATGKNVDGRQEIATGSKNIGNLVGKQLDDGIMTGSTRALRRLTMQFTSLGILDESEVVSVVGQEVNPAGSAQLTSNPMPPFLQPSAPANNAPGKDVTAVAALCGVCKEPLSEHEMVSGQGLVCKSAETPTKSGQNPDIKADTEEPVSFVTPAVAPVTGDTNPDIKADINPAINPATESAKPKRTRKKKVVALDDVVPETVTTVPEKGTVSASVETTVKSETPTPTLVPTQVDSAVPTQVNSVSPSPAVVQGMPNEEQMGTYRKRVSVFTAELPSSENMGSVQKMRAFITKMSGTAPQMMTVEQWDTMIAWFDKFVETNQVKGLVKYINDVLGVK